MDERNGFKKHIVTTAAAGLLGLTLVGVMAAARLSEVFWAGVGGAVCGGTVLGLIGFGIGFVSQNARRKRELRDLRAELTRQRTMTPQQPQVVVVQPPNTPQLGYQQQWDVAPAPRPHFEVIGEEYTQIDE